MSIDDVTPNTLPAPVTDLFAAIAEALAVPLPSTDPADEHASYRLLDRRATHVRVLLESLASHPDVSINRDAADVRKHIAQNPVTYTTFDEQKAADQERGEHR